MIPGAAVEHIRYAAARAKQPQKDCDMSPPGSDRQSTENHVTEDQILDALRPIVDPDFRKSIVDLVFVKDIEIDGTSISFAIDWRTGSCPLVMTWTHMSTAPW